MQRHFTQVHLAANRTEIPTRTATLEGVEHLVVPVVAMKVGVHAGSAGPVYYPAEELRRYAESWNGRPAPVLHPMDGDTPISANTPEALERQAVGTLFNFKFRDDIQALAGEVWINVEKAERVSPGLVSMVLAGQEIDVSTGLWFDFEDTPGEWHGERYIGIARNHVPDHLAILPGQPGACSWADGCGIRANSVIHTVLEGQSMQKVLKVLRGMGARLGFSVQELSHSDVRSQLGAALDEAYAGTGLTAFPVDVYDDRIVYETYASDNDELTERKLFSRSYSVADSKVALGDDATEVVLRKEYDPVTSNREQKTHKEESEMGTNTSAVDALIACSQTKFTEDDREWLLSLKANQLDKLGIASNDENSNPCGGQDGDAAGAAGADAATEQEAADGKPNAPVAEETPTDEEQDEESKGADAPGATRNAAPVSVDQYIANAPAEMQETLRRAVDRDRAVKANLVSRLMANKRNPFDKPFLESKSIVELEGMLKLADVPVDFSVQSGGPKVNASDDDATAPPPPKVWDI